MPLISVKMPDMVTSAGGTASNAIGWFDDAWAITIFSTAASFTSTAVTVAVEHTSTGTAFVTLLSGDDSVLVTAQTARVISPVPFMQLRLEHSGAEAAERTFRVRKTILT